MKSKDTNNKSTYEIMSAEFPSVIFPKISYVFEDYVLIFLAKIAKNNDLLVYKNYELIQTLLLKIFGDYALHAKLQAKLHFFLLEQNNEEIVEKILLLSKSENISEDFMENFINVVSTLHELVITDEAVKLCNELLAVFSQEKLSKHNSSYKKYTNFLQNNLVSSLFKLDLFGKKAEVEQSYTIVTNLFNNELHKKLQLLKQIAWNLQDEELNKRIKDFSKLLQDQDFRVLVLGESKRGKSTLINALLGKELSPMRESLSETSCILEFSYSERTKYEVDFLDEYSYQYLDSFLEDEKDNLVLKNYIENLRQDFVNGFFIPDDVKMSVQNLQQINDYASNDGKYSHFVSKVKVAMPIEFLSSGLVLVDSPGINAINKFHDYLSYDESIRADLVLFLLDARSPCTGSELGFLRKLAKSGRLINIIGVLTHIDKLNDSQKTLSGVREQARLFLLEAIRQASNLELLGVVELNPRELLQQRVQKSKVDPAFNQLLLLIDQAQKNNAEKVAYKAKVSSAANELFAFAGQSVLSKFDEYKKSLPDAKFLELLDRHSASLAEGVEKYVMQAQTFVQVAASDVDEWTNSSLKKLDSLENLLLAKLMQATSQKMLELGKNFAKEENWKDFDNTEAAEIVQSLLDDYQKEQTRTLEAWDEKLSIFAEDIDKLAELCLERVEAEAKNLHEICTFSSNKEHLLLKANDYMRKIAIFSGGVIGGASISMGLIQILTLGLAALGFLTNPMLLLAAGAGGIGLAFLHFQGNEQKIQKAFLERKEKKYKQYIKGIKEKLTEDIQNIRLNIAEKYKLTVLRSFVPVLEIMCDETVNLNLYLKVVDKVKADADIYKHNVQLSLEQLPLKIE